MRAKQWTSQEDESLLRNYRGNISMDVIAEMLGVSRSAVYRRLELLGEPAREHRKRRKSGYYVGIVIYDQAPMLVKRLLQRAKTEQINMSSLGDKSGVNRATIQGWNRGADPLLSNLEAVGRSLGLRLTWVEDTE